MHDFIELIENATEYSLKGLNNVEKKAIDNLETNASTPDIKALQMAQLQKVIISVGMFSMFDSILQEKLECKNGFNEAKIILTNLGKIEIMEEFTNFCLAINVLKHGKGRSYEILISKIDILPFKIKQTNDSFYDEGDISEVNTLIMVDDKFVRNCSKIIYKVSVSLKI